MPALPWKYRILNIILGLYACMCVRIRARDNSSRLELRLAAKTKLSPNHCRYIREPAKVMIVKLTSNLMLRR